MSTIDGRGIVDDGTPNLTVSGVTITTQNAMAPQGVTGSNFCVLPGPGFFQIPVTGAAGQGNFTGSLPAPGIFPGGEILLTDTIGTYPWLITGSMSSFGSSGSTGGSQWLSSSSGTKLFMPPGSTVGFWSDAKSWLICAMSGAASLKP